MYKCAGGWFPLLILSHFSSISYFIFIGYFKTVRGRGLSEPPGLTLKTRESVFFLSFFFVLFGAGLQKTFLWIRYQHS